MNRRAPRVSNAPTRSGQSGRRHGTPERTMGGGIQYFHILPAMNGRDSYGVPAGFAGLSGFLPPPPYFSGGQRRGLTFGLSTRRSFGREEYIPCRKERQSLDPAPQGGFVQPANGHKT